MTKLKILFLDIDGVLNSEHWYDTRPRELCVSRLDDLESMLDPDAVERLNTIVARTGCRLVLSSSWRSLDTISSIGRALKRRGLISPLLGITPPLGSPRGREIQAWLDLVADTVESFVILDDDNDMVHLLPKLVQTSWDSGLQDEHAERAVEILNR